MVFLLAMGIYWASRIKMSSVEKPRASFRLGATQSALLVWLALDQGFFDDQGLDVQVVFQQGGLTAISSLLKRQVDLATCSEFVLTSQILNDKNLRTFGTVALAETVAIVGRKDRGIRGPSDLKGKRIAVTQNSASEYFLGTFLSFNRITLSEVTLVHLPPSEIRDATVSGAVDAGITWDPYAFEIKAALGAEAVRFSAQNHHNFHFLLVGRPEWIADNEKTLDKFIKALFQAERFFVHQKDRAKRILAKRFGYEPHYLSHVLSRQDLVVSLPQSLLVSMEDAAQWKIDTNQVVSKSVPNFLRYIDFDPLDTLSPARVTIIH